MYITSLGGLFMKFWQGNHISFPCLFLQYIHDQSFYTIGTYILAVSMNTIQVTLDVEKCV